MVGVIGFIPPGGEPNRLKLSTRGMFMLSLSVTSFSYRERALSLMHGANTFCAIGPVSSARRESKLRRGGSSICQRVYSLSPAWRNIASRRNRGGETGPLL